MNFLSSEQQQQLVRRKGQISHTHAQTYTHSSSLSPPSFPPLFISLLSASSSYPRRSVYLSMKKKNDNARKKIQGSPCKIIIIITTE